MGRLGQLGLQLYQLKQHGEIAARQQKLSESEHALRGSIAAKEYGSIGEQGEVIPGFKQQDISLRERGMDVQERTAATQEQTARTSEAKLSPREKNWGLGDYTMFSARLRQVGFEPDKLEFMKELKTTAMDNNVNRGAFAENLAASWDQGGKNRFLEDLQKNVDDTLKKNPNANVAKQLQLIEGIQQIKADQVIQSFFPDIAKFDAQNQAALATKEKTAWNVIQDPNSKTGYSYQDMNNPAMIRPGAPPPKENTPKVPSAGNSTDLAIMRKFGDPTYLTDPTKAAQAAQWLGTPEGRQSVRDAAADTTPPQMTPMWTGTGPVPFVTKGHGAGSVGPPIQGAGKVLPNETTTQLSQIKNTVDRINDLEKRAAVPGMSKRFGPVEGRWTALRQKLVEDGPTQALMNEMNGLITMAYALSGKQISYQEMEMLKQAILPTLNQPYANFQATLNMSRQWLTSQHNDTLQYFKDTGHSSNLKPLELPQTGKSSLPNLSEPVKGRRDLKGLSDQELLKLLEGK